MEIPENVRNSIMQMIDQAKAQYSARLKTPLEETMSTTQGQTDLLRSKYMPKDVKLDPELEAKLQGMIDIADDPNSNDYLRQINEMIENLKKGQNFDGNA